MDLTSSATLIEDDILESWQWIGSGGFAEIYRVKHSKWRMDVAIKLLRYHESCGSSLLREAKLMHHGGNPYVLRILGVYEGFPPRSKFSKQLGFVMEYMERGSVAKLQSALNRPPPWSLAFRMTHQIALGMNFLHQLKPPLLHLDLKPSNVLLDDSLNAKLTDFGLAKVAQSASKLTVEKDEDMGGTTSYMPPEAFESCSYTPSFSSDIYSYGVLLWSVITGKEPYSNVSSGLVRFHIPKGERPDLTAFNSLQAVGLTDITELMQCCWNSNLNLRPSFIDCVKVTEKVYELHKQTIRDDVHAVLNQLDGKDKVSSSNMNGYPKENSRCTVKSESTPAQETGGTAVLRPKAAETFGLQTSSGTSYKPAKVPAFSLKAPMTQRQHSTPGSVSISMSNVTGVQIGNNNCMNINMPRQRQRQRHRTGPPDVSSSEPSAISTSKKSTT